LRTRHNCRSALAGRREIGQSVRSVLVLEGSRVILRDFVPEDVAAVAVYSVDEEVGRYQDWQSLTPEAAQAFIDRAITAAEQTPRTNFDLAIIERSSEVLIGDASIGIDSDRDKRAEVGFTLRRDRWGDGLATEAVGLLLAFGFGELGVHRIAATAQPDNTASVRVLEKVGMTYEGRLRDHLFTRGEWRDSLMWSILEPQWRALRL
jgi:[ribosomal protein S5]-alanine N-acetyltransferase